MGPRADVSANAHPRLRALFVCCLLVFGGIALSFATPGRALTAVPSAPVSTLGTLERTLSDSGGVGIDSLPEYFVSPVSGSSYLIQKDVLRGTYRYCSTAGSCYDSPGEIMDREAAGLPVWARVVEPALRDHIARSAPGEEVTIIIEMRDDSFARASAETWERVGGDLRTLETLALRLPENSPSNRATLDLIDSLVDSARHEIYARADLDLAPLLASERARLQASGGTYLGYTPVLPALFARVPLASIPAIAEDARIGRITEDHVVHALMDVSAYAIHADTWWGNGYTGGTWDLTVEDTGIDPTHPALTVDQARVFHTNAQTYPNYGDQPTNPDDLHGHGTHVAGTVASVDGTYRGVAWGLDQLINTKAGWLTTGGGGQMDIVDGMMGVDWAVGTAGADVVSLSFGGNIGAGDTAWERFFDAVVDKLGVAVAIAAGNSGPGSRTVGEPGAGMNILSVGAMDDRNTIPRLDDIIAGFSSRGPTGDGRLKPDVVAPGVFIHSANAFWEGGSPDFVDMSGTSMATPHIAASYILLMNGIGSTFPPRYKALLLNSAADLGTAGGDTTYGWGYVDLQAAFAQRNNVLEGNVSDSPVRYTFFRGPTAAGDRATLVWNRHANYSGGAYPTTYYPLNDIDLFSYNEADGARLAGSTRTVDNVEQVAAGGTFASTVYKVKLPGAINGVPQEHFALAAPAGTAPIAAPALSVTMNVPPTNELGSVFTVSADVRDTGALAAHGVAVTLSLPAGLTLVSGASPQSLGSIPAGAVRSASWQVRGDRTGIYSVSTGVASTSYEESFTATSGAYPLEIVDSTLPTSSVSGLPATEMVPAFTVTATAFDLGGVATVELFYRKDGGAWTSAGVDSATPWSWIFDTVPLGGDGTYDFYSVATDSSANVEPAPAGPDASTLVDTAPPVSVLATLPTYVTTTTVDLVATASDSGSGVSSVTLYYRLAGGPWTSLGSDSAAPYLWTFDSATAGGDGIYEFYVVATDGIGNVEPKPQAPETSTTIDTIAPTTGTNPSGTLGANSWYVTDVFLRLLPMDGGSGVASTAFRVDGGSWQPYAGAFWVTGDGTHTVEYYSTDRAGNAEGTRTLAIRIDTHAPFSTHSFSGTLGVAGWYTSDVTATIVGADNASGVDTVQYQVDGGAWLVYSAPVAITGEGVHSLAFYATDLAGLLESVQFLQVRIDATPPVSQRSLSGTAGGGGWYTSEVVVSLNAADGGSGVASTKIRVDGGAWQTYSAPVPVPGEGSHTVEYLSSDVAGNTESVRTTTFRIDTLDPLVAIDSPRNGDVLGTSTAEVRWTSSDSGSGLSECTIVIDGGAPVSVGNSTSRMLTDLQDGAHSATVRCDDVSGHSATSHIDFSVDTSPFSLKGGFGSLLPLILIILVVATILIIAFALARRRRREESPTPAPRPAPRPAPPPPPPEDSDEALWAPIPEDDLPPPPP